MATMEEWRPVEGTTYTVSNKGRVQNKRGRILKPSKTSTGYLYVNLTIPGRKTQKHSYVHRLVATAFIPNPEKLPDVHHIDHKHYNNVLSNLTWQSMAQNHGNTRKTKASNHVRAVQQIAPDGSLVRTWSSLKEASDATGSPYSGVHACCQDRQDTAGEWSWEYVPDGVIENEQWRPCAKYLGCEVSSEGRIRTPKYVTAGAISGNYLAFRGDFVHRLVADEYCLRPTGCDFVNHKDGDPHV